MSVDSSSLYLLAAFVAAMLGLWLLYFGRQQQMAALNWAGTAYVLGGVAIALWTQLVPLFGHPISTFAGAIGIAACGLILNAARIFHGRRPVWQTVAVAVAAWSMASIAWPADDGARLSIGAAIVALFAALSSAQLWSERRRSMKRCWPALTIPVLHGCVLLLPVVAGDVLAGFASVSVRWTTIFAVELMLYAIGTVFVIVMMVSERCVSVHKTAARTDPLTGILNRRGFADAASRMMARGGEVSLLVFDVDRFKSINDRFGHVAGDEVLKMFAATITHNLRITDLTGRFGGEEFVALLPCAMKDAAVAAERVRQAFATSDIAIDDEAIESTVSIGIAGGHATDLAALLAAADAALYRAKSGGRNRVELADMAIAPKASIAALRAPKVVRRAPTLRQFSV